jgi:hypothetical protein
MGGHGRTAAPPDSKSENKRGETTMGVTAQKTAKAAKAIWRKQAKRALEAIEAGSLAMEASLAAKGPKARRFVMTGSIFAAIMWTLFYVAAPGALRRDSLAAQSPAATAAQERWATRQMVLAPESEIDESLYPIQNEWAAQHPEALEARIRDAVEAAKAKGDGSRWRAPLLRSERLELLARRGVDLSRGAGEPILVVESREDWEAGAKKREELLAWAKSLADSNSLAGQAARELLAQTPSEPVPIGLAGALALKDGGDGSPSAMFAAAKAAAESRGFRATLPFAPPGASPEGGLEAFGALAASRAAGEQEKSALAFESLVSGLVDTMARCLAAALAAGLLASAAGRGAGAAAAWVLGGARLARWGAWRALRAWGLKAALMGLAAVAAAGAGALATRAGADISACKEGGCEAFAVAVHSVDPREAGAKEAKAELESGTAKAGALWAIKTDSGARKIAAKWGRAEANPVLAAAAAEQEWRANADRGFWTFIGAAIGLAAAAGVVVARQQALAKAAKAKGAPVAAAIGEKAWQQEQIEAARARAEAKELAMAVGLAARGGMAAAAAGVLASGSARAGAGLGAGDEKETAASAAPKRQARRL